VQRIPRPFSHGRGEVRPLLHRHASLLPPLLGRLAKARLFAAAGRPWRKPATWRIHAAQEVVDVVLVYVLEPQLGVSVHRRGAPRARRRRRVARRGSALDRACAQLRPQHVARPKLARLSPEAPRVAAAGAALARRVARLHMPRKPALVPPVVEADHDQRDDDEEAGPRENSSDAGYGAAAHARR